VEQKMSQDDSPEHYIALIGETLKAIGQSIRKNSVVEAETRARINASRKLLDETAEMVEAYKPTK
jgi:hypothetical protein